MVLHRAEQKGRLTPSAASGEMGRLQMGHARTMASDSVCTRQPQRKGVGGAPCQYHARPARPSGAGLTGAALRRTAMTGCAQSCYGKGADQSNGPPAAPPDRPSRPPAPRSRG